MSESQPDDVAQLRVRVVGNGRAGGSFATALRRRGVDVEMADRTDLQGAARDDGDLVLICTPDDVIADVAAGIAPGSAVVGHCSGSRKLDVLAPHDRRCSIHPLMSLPDPMIGSSRLLDRCHFAVAGDPVARRVVEALGGIAFDVSDDDRAAYHATASIAANHLVALCAEVESMAARIGVDPAGFWAMMATVLDNVVEHGATAALTGPIARGDWATVRAHLEVLDRGQQDSYLALARVAARTAGQQFPTDLS